MYNLDIVVGAGYGDEGKGRITSFLANEYDANDTVVVIATGSAQRGHTAWNKDMTIRHVFHHFGSATLDGYDTYIPNTYRVNPLMFRKEYEELRELGITPTVYLDKNCYIVLPHHMLINQCVEELKAIDGRQSGSCGMGVYESIMRNVFRDGTSFTVDNFIKSIDNLEDMIGESFTIGYLQGRIMCYEIPLTSRDKIDKYNEYRDIYNDRNIIKSFIDDFKFMLEHCVLVDSIEDVKRRYHNFVFECSQGLGINQGAHILSNEFTPMQCGAYATVGLINSFEESERNITINYVTRWYATKHGGCAVPCFDESLHFEDKTNVYNKWQRNMTFGYLNIDNLIHCITIDKNHFKNEVHSVFNVNLFITCFDQIEDVHKVKFVYDGKMEYGFNNLIQTISDKFNKTNIYTFLNENNDSLITLVNKRKSKNDKLEEHFYLGKPHQVTCSPYILDVIDWDYISNALNMRMEDLSPSESYTISTSNTSNISNISNTANSITFSQTAATYNTDLNNIHTTNGSSYWVRYL